MQFSLPIAANSIDNSRHAKVHIISVNLQYFTAAEHMLR